VTCDARLSENRKQFQGDRFEGVGAAALFRLALDPRIDSVPEVPASFIAILASLLERDLGIGAKRQRLFLAQGSVDGEAILEPPQPTAVRRQQKKQALLIEELLRLLGRA
jgi:hypothetical protein